ncbi:hypothetical protein GCM10008957_27820 [Deinococcus ruber]|uniref:Uncharacterized protein n=1 Tax=Deinococcus ruber TaxID=1848197 RepID=A0A918CBU1_9DEIO|nr:hypothetical protein GCM10008957_27820 [Deinococcus ruber]
MPDGFTDRTLLQVQAAGTWAIPEAVCARYLQLGGPGCGWVVSWQACLPPPRRLSPEALARVRRGHLERRVRRQLGPLFADEVIAAELAKKPGYYAGTEHRPADRLKDDTISSAR